MWQNCLPEMERAERVKKGQIQGYIKCNLLGGFTDRSVILGGCKSVDPWATGRRKSSVAEGDLWLILSVPGLSQETLTFQAADKGHLDIR